MKKLFTLLILVTFIRLTSAQRLGTSAQYSMYICDNNKIDCWGLGSNKWTITPTQVMGLTDIKAIGCGAAFSVGLKADGTVWAWGKNDDGELGDGTYVNSDLTQVKDLINVKEIACGDNHSIALKDDGTVWAWGYNIDGQLGNGTFISSNIPVQVTGLSDVKAIACGNTHSLAIKNDGTVWSWGENVNGDATIPSQITPLTNIVEVAGGHVVTLALSNDGTVWALGRNQYGQLGDSTFTSEWTPVKVKGISGVKSVKCGSINSMALKTDGTVWTWGSNTFGQIGDGTKDDRWLPTQVNGMFDIVEISASEHDLALSNSGELWSWGLNYWGQIGDGTCFAQKDSFDSANYTKVSPVKVILLCTTTGIHESEKPVTANIFPNPTSSELNVSMNQYQNNVSVNIKNLSGLIVMSKANLSGDHFAMDFSEQANGIYFLEVKCNMNITNYKFIKY